jgi:hypothetical protein
MLITVFMDTTIQHHFTETNEIPFDEDTLPIPEKFLEPLYENSDGDEAPNVIDRFPDDPNEWKDTDGDLTGDNSDVFPEDYYEQLDTDGDGHGDFGDPDPNDPNNPTKLVIVSPEGSDAEKNGDGTTGSGSDAEKNGDGTTGSGSDAEKNGGQGLGPIATEEEFSLKSKTKKTYANGWSLHVIKERKSENDQWNTIEIWYTDPNGVKNQKLPAKFKKKKENSSLKSI